MRCLGIFFSTLYMKYLLGRGYCISLPQYAENFAIDLSNESSVY
jgi:hypothetical protein